MHPRYNELNQSAHEHGHVGGWLVQLSADTEQLYAVINDSLIYSTTVARPNVYFDVPERDYLEYSKLAKAKDLPRAGDQKLPVFIGLANEADFPREGVIDFRANSVDPQTGTITVRGVLQNPDGLLTPGLYARVQVPIGRPEPRLLVPRTEDLEELAKIAAGVNMDRHIQLFGGGGGFFK